MDDPRTAGRELRALWELMGEAGLEEGTVIVGSGKDCNYERDGKCIRQIPAWQWLLLGDAAL